MLRCYIWHVDYYTNAHAHTFITKVTHVFIIRDQSELPSTWFSVAECTIKHLMVVYYHKREPNTCESGSLSLA